MALLGFPSGASTACSEDFLSDYAAALPGAQSVFLRIWGTKITGERGNEYFEA